MPVFDRTLPVKQIHVLETLDLLVLRADKGAAPQMAALRRARWRVAHCSQPQGRWVWGLVTVSSPLSVLWSFGGPLVRIVEGRGVSFSHDYVEQACYGVATVACIPENFPTLVCVSDWEYSAFSLSPGKDARLFVFRLSAVQKGLDGRQTGRSRSDCRENKLEKTKGEGWGGAQVGSAYLDRLRPCIQSLGRRTCQTPAEPWVRVPELPKWNLDFPKKLQK